MTIDSKLTLTEMSTMCKVAHHHLQAVRHVRKYVSEDVTKSIGRCASRLLKCCVHHTTILINCYVFRTL